MLRLFPADKHEGEEFIVLMIYSRTKAYESSCFAQMFFSSRLLCIASACLPLRFFASIYFTRMAR